MPSGRIVAVGAGVSSPTASVSASWSMGWLRTGDDIEDWGYWGSEADGGFAEYCTSPTENAVKVESALSDVELATFMSRFPLRRA